MTEFRLELPPGDGARPAAALIARALRTWEIQDDDGTVRLVVTELIENVHLHTDGGAELRMALNDDGILILVADASPVVPELRNRPCGDVGGRGLQIVRALAKDWGVRPGARGKVVWAELAVTAPGDGGSGAIRGVRAPVAADPSRDG